MSTCSSCDHLKEVIHNSDNTLEEYPAMPGTGFARTTLGPKAFQGHIGEFFLFV
jgi:hypothetical protein